MFEKTAYIAQVRYAKNNLKICANYCKKIYHGTMQGKATEIQFLSTYKVIKSFSSYH